MISTTDFTAPMPTWSAGFKEKGVMFIEYALHPFQTHRWFRFLKQDPVLDALAKISPHLLTRAYKPYLSPRLRYADRITLLVNHYRIVVKARYGDLLRKCAARPQVLHEFTGKSGVPYQLTLASVDPARRDGEMTLRLMSQGTVIYTASFVFALVDGLPCIRLGGLQGLLADGQTPGIRQITRDLYGCRPRDLMVHAVREIGQGFGCAKLILTGNDNKLPSAEPRVCAKSSDYNRLWKECHAAPRGDGDYELPCADVGRGLAGNADPACEPRMCARLLDAVLAALRMRLGRERSAGDPALPGWSHASEGNDDRYGASVAALTGKRTTQ